MDEQFEFLNLLNHTKLGQIGGRNQVFKNKLIEIVCDLKSGFQRVIQVKLFHRFLGKLLH